MAQYTEAIYGTELRIQQSRRWTLTAYLAPISYKGWLTWWPGQHTSWRNGFVVRFLWFGFLLRWGYIPKLTGRQINQVIRGLQLEAGRYDEVVGDLDFMVDLPGDNN